MRWVLLAVVLSLGGASEAQAWDSPVPDVVIYCTPALEGALRAASSGFSAARHVAVHIFVAPPEGLIGLVRHRARADVVAADSRTVDAMASQGLVRAESVTALGNDPFVLIGNAAPAEHRSTDMHITVVPDQTSAASFDGVSILRAALPGAAAQGVADTPDVIAAVRSDSRKLGLVSRSEAHAPGVTEAASLPVPPLRMEGALVVNGQSRNAGPWLEYVATLEGREALRQFGLEGGP